MNTMIVSFKSNHPFYDEWRQKLNVRYERSPDENILLVEAVITKDISTPEKDRLRTVSDSASISLYELRQNWFCVLKTTFLI